MKKILCLLLCLTLVLTLFAGCGMNAGDSADSNTGDAADTTVSDDAANADDNAAPDAADVTDAEPVVIRVASLKGPTTMGLVKLLSDAEAGVPTAYTVESGIYGTADEITGQLITGELDMAAIPANLAANLYQKSEGRVLAAAVNTLGVLYVVENGDTVQSVEDLRGKTVYSTGKGTTPEYALNAVLNWNGLDPASDLTVEFKSEATEIAAIMETESDVIAVLPQPYVTTVQMQNESVRVALDLTEEWESASGRTLVTGVLVVNADFAAEHPDAVAAFLADYEASVAYTETNPEDTAALIESYGIVPKAAVALKALPYCNITFLGADDMKAALSSYLETLYEQNPASVGGELPDEAFYYGAQ